MDITQAGLPVGNALEFDRLISEQSACQDASGYPWFGADQHSSQLPITTGSGASGMSVNAYAVAILDTILAR